jgi:catalase
LTFCHQQKYLAQCYNISEDYAQGIYNLLPNPDFVFGEVEKLAKEAVLFYKEPKFRPSNGEKLVGKVPSVPVYNPDS